MAISPKNKYPTQIDLTDPTGYPEGKAKNVTVAGDGTGTPLEKDLVNDLFGFQQELLNKSGITPSGIPDKVGASQYKEALDKLYKFKNLTTLEIISNPDMGVPVGQVIEAVGYSVVGDSETTLWQRTGNVIAISQSTDNTSTNPPTISDANGNQYLSLNISKSVYLDDDIQTEVINKDNILLSNTTYSVPNIIKLKTGNTLEGQGWATSNISGGITTNYVISIGNVDDATPNGSADFVSVRNLGIINSSSAAGGILIPSEIDDQPAWNTPSRFFSLENINVVNFQAGTALTVNAHSGHVEAFKATTVGTGLSLGAAVNGVSFKDFNVTGSSVHGIVTKNINDGTQGKSVTFVNTIIQNHTGSDLTKTAMLMRSGIAFNFEGLYLENNHTGGATVDAIIEGEGYSFSSVFWTPTVGQNATCFNVKGDNFSLNHAEILADGKYLVEFQDNAKSAEVRNIYIGSFDDVQAIVHDNTNNGLKWFSNNGKNELLNPSFQVAQSGTEFLSPADDSYVMDVWNFRSIAGGGVAPTIDVRRSTVTPNSKFPYSLEIDVTASGTADAARRVNINQSLDVTRFKGQRVSLAVMLAADTTLNFDQFQVQLGDGVGFRTKNVTQLTTNWQTFWIPLDVDSAATSLFFTLAIDKGNGTVPVGKIRMCAPIIAIGGDQPCFEVAKLDDDTRAVKRKFERIQLDNRGSLCTGAMETASTARGVFEYTEKESVPTLTAVGDYEVREGGAWRTAANPAFQSIGTKRATITLDTIAGAAARAAMTIHGDNTTGNYIDVDAR